MVYECDRCASALPAGVSACPCCGEKFDEAVPPDAILPKAGFHVLNVEPLKPGMDKQNPAREEVTENLAQAEADIAALRSQAIVLKSEVMTLRGHISTLISEMAALEDHSATLQSHSAVLQSQVTTLTNRLTVLEMAGREDKRRFMDHVQHVKEALGYIQINSPAGTAGQSLE